MSAGTTVRPDHRLAAEHGVVGDLHRLALDHDVHAAVPPVAAGGKHDVRPSVSPDGGDPEQLRLLQRPAGLLPAGGGRGEEREVGEHVA